MEKQLPMLSISNWVPGGLESWDSTRIADLELVVLMFPNTKTGQSPHRSDNHRDKGPNDSFKSR